MAKTSTPRKRKTLPNDDVIDDRLLKALMSGEPYEPEEPAVIDLTEEPTWDRTDDVLRLEADILASNGDDADPRIRVASSLIDPNAVGHVRGAAADRDVLAERTLKLFNDASANGQYVQAHRLNALLGELTLVM